VSLGGFFDGIVLHQILGWHHLICRTETCRPVSIEMLQQQGTEDGWFHLAMWASTVAGVWMLARAPGRASRGQVLGSLIAGWGGFNLVEGVINHHLLGLHSVLPASPHALVFDLLFLLSGAIAAIAGWLIAGRRSVAMGR
jgi:uncharacterized membrane protein